MSSTTPGPAHEAYAAAGVDYVALDAGKRSALSAALETSSLLGAHGAAALDASRGEPAFVFTLGDRAFAFVLEGLGTKSVIARMLEDDLGPGRFADVAYDAVAAIVNDLCCVGAAPLVVNAYFATGESAWYDDAPRHAALIDGWLRACVDAGATWGGGESPTLPGLLAAPDIELAGSAVGILPPGVAPILGQDLHAGDEIVLVASSGLHANGSSLARAIADQLGDGYRTRLPSGRSFGDALLDPSLLYAPLVARLLAAKTPIHYLSHITGHGLLKLMRPSRDFTYEIGRLPPVPEVLAFLAAEAELAPDAAYSTLNMGSGFAVYCAAGHGPAVVGHAAALGLEAVQAGYVRSGPRRVILRPVGVTYETEAMDLTPGA